MGESSRVWSRLATSIENGGSCFPKDTLALTRTAQEHNAPIRIVETVVEVNDARKRKMAEKIIDACDGKVAGKKIAVLGVTFKPDTDDMRDAPSLTIVPALIGAGADVVIVDPEGRKEGEALLPGATWEEDVYQAAADAHCIALLTEWNELRGLDLPRLNKLMSGDVMVDLRNVYRPDVARRAGFEYVSVGRP